MKIFQTCSACNRTGKQVSTVEIKEADREKFMQFIDMARNKGLDGTVPPSKYPKTPLVIPAPGQNPCPHCKHGEATVGPSGCGRGQSCLAYIFYQYNNLHAATVPSTADALKDFLCGAQTAEWAKPPKRARSARFVALPGREKPAPASAPRISRGRARQPTTAKSKKR